MPKTTSEYSNPKRTPPIRDFDGNYDLDGVSQSKDFEVIVASDKTRPNRPSSAPKLSHMKDRFKKWLADWDD